ncbi:hypothetical protein HBI56_122530 [Parastagonospora nodorum]|uniref:Secreted protein n=1 Tax=Phaeosphaeria nodorum (strain SN15 / ATCC MYA-4574 / FGSC 10173) TaxID=321614 RepID=A0A7U2FFM3_PHANO|nr:hypothetical protein HBH56_052150 [Parastagonospora nodorum]QRD02155.1 hypothetical protein JI435_303600 [Parastagonospora nodorum SN15]KAH3935743.1 hypothetical protein HBH54_037940 [Parastagonospora nodorum]KAH3948680.1 hypothetical protein HBH53_101220 [Parastagonospora nodorum]KAH3989143.1 hypothetical protein HBH52_026650 [Parastagonospora nodorum]
MFWNLYTPSYTRWAALQRLALLSLLPCPFQHGVEDVEAAAGMIHRRSTGLSLETDHTFVEMQPHTTLLLYFDSSMTSPAVPVGARDGS